MTNKHTPGPWEVYDAENRPGIEAPSVGFSIVVYGLDEDVTVGEDQCGVYGRTPEEGAANAHLIAAAPELLAALKLLLSGAHDHQPGIAEAEAAIAKAEGRS